MIECLEQIILLKTNLTKIFDLKWLIIKIILHSSNNKFLKLNY